MDSGSKKCVVIVVWDASANAALAAITVASIFVTRMMIDNCERTRLCPHYVGFNANQVLAELDPEEAHLAPVFAPRVANDPVLTTRLTVNIPSDKTDGMRLGPVVQLRRIPQHSACIIFDQPSID